jgi:hypothetical protein
VGPVVVAVDVSAGHLPRLVEGLELVRQTQRSLSFENQLSMKAWLSGSR